MRIVVIGGTGFIGQPLTEKLVTAGHDVSVFHRGVTAISTRGIVNEAFD